MALLHLTWTRERKAHGRWAVFGLTLVLSSAAGCAGAQSSPTPFAQVTATPPVANEAESKQPGLKQARPAPGAVQHVVVVTIDGLMPDSYLHPEQHQLAIPNLLRLVREGASSEGALSVFPSLTYPAHTSIASGNLPARHGIVTNLAFDPLEVNQTAWRWYDEEVKVPRLWDVAREAGLRTAVLDWPVTVGETATYHVPEFWRAKVSEDLKLISALSTPELLHRVAAAFPEFLSGFRPQDVMDQSGTDLAVYAIQTGKPHVLFLHIWQVDAAQHKYGLDSAEARAAIETADSQVGRLLQALEDAGIAERSVLVVASDHGFSPVARCVNPQYLLERAGLVRRDSAGKVQEWSAAVLASHGAAYVYLKTPENSALQRSTLKVFTDAKNAGNSGISRILGRREIAELGGDPNAFLALESELGTYFGTGHDTYQTPASYRATHGYDPHRPEMQAALLMRGATVTHGRLVDAQLVDIAPTLAQMLGLHLGPSDGKLLRVERQP